MSQKTIPARVTISRDSRDVISIRITDDLSGTRFATLTMSPQDFAMTVTGMSEVNAPCVVSNLDRVGLKKISEPRIAHCHLDTYDKKELTEWLENNCQEDGWFINTYLGSQKSITHIPDGGRRLSYTVFRFVEATSQEGGAA